MKLAIAQINLTVGDLRGNAARIAEAARTAHAAGADLLLTPELSLTGYPPEDLVLREAFLLACARELHALAAALAPLERLAVLVGYPQLDGGERYNAMALLRGGTVAGVYRKHKLPNHSVFDEPRTFMPGNEPFVFACGGVRVGVNICGDIWEPGSAEIAAAAGAQLLVVPNASPFHMGKHATRLAVARARIAEAGIPLVYGNLIGGQDELVFDGASFVMDARGVVTQQFPAWREGVFFVECLPAPVAGEMAAEPNAEASVYEALKLGLRDFLRKNGLSDVHLGLSGGIDSALVLALAVDALGAEHVHAVMMPSDYTASISLEDARDMAEGLGVKYSEIPIKPVYDAFLNQLAEEFDDLPFDLTEENLQARTRGSLLMALSNKFGSLVLATGNKSEMAVGYATLYGDMAGGFAPLKDVSKTQVYRLSRWRNAQGDNRRPVIPRRIIERAPSAELRPDQTDQDSLPPYDILDDILERYVERDHGVADILAAGFDPETVRHVLRLVDRAEFKRRQAAPGTRIRERNFGKDRRYPITSRYRPEENET